MITSSTDLSDEQNRIQARYELNRAIDTSDSTGLAGWAQKWGEACMSATECADGHGVSFLAGVLSQQLACDLMELREILNSSDPDITNAVGKITKAQGTQRALATEIESLSV